jgi:hypothetical protein
VRRCLKHSTALSEVLLHEFAARHDRDYLFLQRFKVMPIAYAILERL